MATGLDVIVVDDEPTVCETITEMVQRFHTWGDVVSFTDPNEAIAYCKGRGLAAAIFVLDVFAGEKNAFDILDAVADNFPSVYEDTIMVTGAASDDVVDMCIAAGVNHLLEKPLKTYELQLAVRSVVAKYLNFATKLMRDEAFAKHVAGIGEATG